MIVIGIQHHMIIIHDTFVCVHVVSNNLLICIGFLIMFKSLLQYLKCKEFGFQYHKIQISSNIYCQLKENLFNFSDIRRPVTRVAYQVSIVFFFFCILVYQILFDVITYVLFLEWTDQVMIVNL